MHQKHPPRKGLGFLAILVAVLTGWSVNAHAQKNVVQPGDPIIASSPNSPGSEGVANVIDGQPTKYLNFDSGRDGAVSGFSPSGFVVSPSVGVTRVTGIAIESANDAPERDPKEITLEGSNDDSVTNFNSGTWEQIVHLTDIPAFANRFQKQSFSFDNLKPYKHYRWTVLATQTANTCCMQVAEVELLGSTLPADVTQPGDPIIASSPNSPGSEGVANVIDGQPTKYLNFDSGRDGKVNGFSPSGFIVSPSIGRTVVSGITIESANDAPERDPKDVTLEGSNDDAVTNFNSGTWEMIATVTNIPPFASRFQKQTFLFDNFVPYRHYRWTVNATSSANTCCMQVAEVELLGTGAPKDVTQPGDAIIASSPNSPGSEGVANAIDGQPTKYLNFDSGRDGKVNGFSPSGFVVTPSIGATTVTGLSMESANDAPERDVKEVLLEGSNDDTIASFDSGTWETIAHLTDIPAYTARFQTQEIFFPNKKAYKHYRWTVLATQTANTCCMQIAEVEFLAVTEGADCNKARFLTQPIDTPVLEGNPATFTVNLNGPWPLQWYKNGTAIPGATALSYTTDAVTAANATNVYTAQIVGCEASTPVKATIFKPSSVKSIGIHFVGSGANGAPTSMNPTDIAGVQPQAYWINAPGVNSDTLPDVSVDPPAMVVDSDNKESSIIFDWTASGTWGAGTGVDSPTQRLLNGVVIDNQGGDPATFTFSNVPDGSHTVIVYVVSPPLEFQDLNYTIKGTTEQTYYIRAMNSDEYNAAPGFYRGASTDVNNRTIANFIRFENVHPAGGVITLSVNEISTGTDLRSGLNAIQLLLNAPSAGSPPAITSAPQPTAVVAGGVARLSVVATGDNLTFQWRKNGKNLPNGGNITGATSATLTISSASDADEGIYSVAVFNPAGSALSKNVAVRLSKFDINEDMVGYFKFDDSSSTTAANAVTGGSAATVNGAASHASGKIGSALAFDGGSTYAVVNNYTKAQKELAVSAWVNVGQGAATDLAIVRNAQGGLAVGGANAGQFELVLRLNADDGSLNLSAAIAAGPNIVRAIDSKPFPVGSWQNVAFSADGAQLRLYINGKEVASTDYSAAINTPNVNYLTVGAQLVANADTGAPEPDGSNPNFFVGQIDDLAIWNRGLSATETAKIYDAGNKGQGVTTVVVDKPSTVVPGTLTVTTSAGQISVAWTAGKLQTASAVNGPWTDSTATSPLTEQTTGTAKFYRTVSQ